ncbi:hypothetical protein DK26_14845 [Bosea sp. WAO]|uniref:YaaC family protein n=1 Tax=Bosea sp. WAO TaxID=406341 RepID=UPI0007479243|nr:hypothetical protein [Bosea sp. WAO]KUL94295.1 hypothetical protein DK26_14845 [Bosea sp. WAO]
MVKLEERVEQLVAEDAQEALRLRLRRMTSATICDRMLADKHPSMTSNLRRSKAEGVASAVRSALGFWEAAPTALNARLLSQYYFALQLSIAEQVAGPDENASLETIQRHTEQGHGLGTLRALDGVFPENYFVAALKSGHFGSYCRAKGHDVDAFAFDSRPRSWSKVKEEERARLVSLTDLLRRIPELRPLIPECLGLPPLSFHLVHALKNLEIESELRAEHLKRTGKFPASPVGGPNNGNTKTTYLLFSTGFGGGQGITAAFLSSLGFPIQNIVAQKEDDDPSPNFMGEYVHPENEFWWQSLPLYKAATGTSIVVPLWQTHDLFVIHFVTLYALSIVVRYLPSLWHEIENGVLDHIKALLDHYTSVVSVVLPQMGIQRITGVRLNLIYPGSGSSPI